MIKEEEREKLKKLKEKSKTPLSEQVSEEKSEPIEPIIQESDIQEDIDMIGDVRGLGLMIGIELVKDRMTKKPAVKEAERILKTCFKKGLVLLSCGESVVRIMPPLVITREELDNGLNILLESIKKVSHH